MPNWNARRLRSEPTDAERRLWFRLRQRQIDGHRFRRQVPLGPYIVDLACLEARLIIEVDGSQHAENPADDERTAWLEAQGFRVVRFWNNEVLGSIDGVLIMIVEQLRGGPPTPTLPHKGGGS